MRGCDGTLKPRYILTPVTDFNETNYVRRTTLKIYGVEYYNCLNLSFNLIQMSEHMKRRD